MFSYTAIQFYPWKYFFEKGDELHASRVANKKSIRKSTHTVYTSTCDLLNYTDRTRCTREIRAVWDCCFPSSSFSVYSDARSLFGVGKSWLPSHPPAVSEMSVYRGTIDKRIVLPCDFTLRFHETDGGSGVNYQSAFKLRPDPDSGASASIWTPQPHRALFLVTYS